MGIRYEKLLKIKKVSFNETSMYETPNGDLIAFMRSEAFGDQACIARSIDGGKTFGEWKSMGVQRTSSPGNEAARQ